MGTRDILPIGSPSGIANGRTLQSTWQHETMVWYVGPSEYLQNISIPSAKARCLDRLLTTPGTSIPDVDTVPEYFFRWRSWNLLPSAPVPYHVDYFWTLVFVGAEIWRARRRLQSIARPDTSFCGRYRSCAAAIQATDRWKLH